MCLTGKYNADFDSVIANYVPASTSFVCLKNQYSYRDESFFTAASFFILFLFLSRQSKYKWLVIHATLLAGIAS